MPAAIQAVTFELPTQILGNEELAALSPHLTSHKIASKTGIRERRIAAPEECASDLAFRAANRLFEEGACERDEIDFLLLCTQSPDYLLPTTACLLQDRLGLQKSVGALDINLGCSGYIYCLGLAKGLIESGQATNVLLLTADTYSRFIPPERLNVRTLFGDAAAATLVHSVNAEGTLIGPLIYGTDGSGGKNLIAPGSGLRPRSDSTKTGLIMNGPEIFTFTLSAVPGLVQNLLQRTEQSIADIDLFVFHQANEYMLKHLRDKLQIPEEKFFISMADCGNTVSSSIPIALRQAMDQGVLRPGSQVVLVGFGVGYSWGATLVQWQHSISKRQPACSRPRSRTADVSDQVDTPCA